MGSTCPGRRATIKDTEKEGDDRLAERHEKVYVSGAILVCPRLDSAQARFIGDLDGISAT